MYKVAKLINHHNNQPNGEQGTFSKINKTKQNTSEPMFTMAQLLK